MPNARARSDDAREARRSELLGAALQEFFDKGLAAARMEDIARRAGFSKGTVYLYFDSKEALFTALIEDVAMPNVAMLEAAIGAAPTMAAAIDRIAAIAPHLIATSNVPKIMKIMVGEAAAFPELAAAYRRTVIDRMFAAMTALMARARDAGEVDIDEPDLAIRLIVAPVVLSAVWRIVFAATDDAPVDLERLFAMHADMLKRGFGIGVAQ